MKCNNSSSNLDSMTYSGLAIQSSACVAGMKAAMPVQNVAQPAGPVTDLIQLNTSALESMMRQVAKEVNAQASKPRGTIAPCQP